MQELRDICYRKAHEMYGEDLPVQVSSRLEKELNSIISNGYAVMYIIAQKLVWKSVEDGYLGDYTAENFYHGRCGVKIPYRVTKKRKVPPCTPENR